MRYLVLAVDVIAIVLLLLGQRWLPGKPVALVVVILSIAAATVFGLPALGGPTTGEIPAGLPTLAGPALRLVDVEGIVPLAAGCLLLAIGRAHLRGKARISFGPAAGVSRRRGRQSRGRDGTWLLCLPYARIVSALPDRALGRSAKGGAGSSSSDRFWDYSIFRLCSACGT
jgi:hypothetical protein